MDAAELLKAYWPYAIAIAPGLFAVWKQWDAGREAVRKAAALEREASERAGGLERDAEHKATALASEDRRELIKIAQDAASSVIGDLRAEIKRLQEQVNELESELNSARREHAETISAKDAKITMLEGELRQWMTLAASYEEKLTRAGIDHEPPRQPFWGVSAGMPGEAAARLVEGMLPRD